MSAQRMRFLEQEVSRLRGELRVRPIRTAHPNPTSPSLIRIQVKTTANNKALGYSSLRGAKYTSTPITVAAPLSSAYDPNAETAITDDGIAYALQEPGNIPCLIFNAPVENGSVSAGGMLTFDLPRDCVFLAYRQVAIPVSGGTTISAWEAYWA
jgi:hypothetical protein